MIKIVHFILLIIPFYGQDYSTLYKYDFAEYELSSIEKELYSKINKLHPGLVHYFKEFIDSKRKNGFSLNSINKFKLKYNYFVEFKKKWASSQLLLLKQNKISSFYNKKLFKSKFINHKPFIISIN